MMGMDKMLSSMIGLSPEQLRDMATGIQEAVFKAVHTLEELKEQNGILLAKMEALENGNGNGSGSNGSKQRGRRAGSGDSGIAAIGAGSGAGE